MNDTTLKELLANENNCIIYNQNLARNLGIHIAIYIGALYKEWNNYLKIHNLDKSNSFTTTAENIENLTSINYEYQSTFNKLLSKLDVLYTIENDDTDEIIYKINENTILKYQVC